MTLYKNCSNHSFSDGYEVRYEGEAKGDEVLVNVISKSQLRCLFCLRRNATKMTTLITMPIMIAIMTTKTSVDGN